MNDELLDELSEVEVEFDNEYKKRRLKKSVKVFLKFGLLVVVFIFIYSFLFSSWVKNYEVVVQGNFFISSEEVIKYSKIDPSKSILLSRLVESDKNLEDTEIIESAIVEYDGFDKITITVTEAPVLFKSDTKFYLKSGYSFDSSSTYPAIYFGNFEEVEKQDKVIEELVKIYNDAPEVFEYISQIAYSPDAITNDRLMIVMRDSNKVYLTTNQIYSHMSVYFVYIDKIYSELGEVHGEISFDKGGEFIEY